MIYKIIIWHVVCNIMIPFCSEMVSPILFDKEKGLMPNDETGFPLDEGFTA